VKKKRKTKKRRKKEPKSEKEEKDEKKEEEGEGLVCMSAGRTLPFYYYCFPLMITVTLEMKTTALCSSSSFSW
jgi:hypothetical protein